MFNLIRVAAVAAAALIASAANAVTTTIDFNNSAAPGFTGSYSLFTDTISGVAVTVDGTQFLAAPANGQNSGTATYNSTNRITSVTFDWGTPDSYNTLSFGNAAGATISPIGFTSAITGNGLGATSYTYNFNGSDNVHTVNFGTTQRAFEIDNLSVTAVPEPGAWALMLVGFVMVGASVRRRSTTIVAA